MVMGSCRQHEVLARVPAVDSGIGVEEARSYSALTWKGGHWSCRQQEALARAPIIESVIGVEESSLY